MEISSVEDVVAYLRRNRAYLHEKFGITRIGIFGSFARGEQTPYSDIDLVIEMEKNKKNIHSFFQLKRFIEKEIGRKVDIGFEHALKPAIKEKIKEQVIYV